MNINNNDKIDLSYSVETGKFYYFDGNGAIQEFAPAPSSAALGYKSYIATLTQSSTTAPVATVLSSTLSATPVWSYSDVGDFRLTLSGEFPTASKVAIFGLTDSSTSIASFEKLITAGWNGTSSIYLQSMVISLGGEPTDFIRTLTNGLITNMPIEIRVYD